ncbi:glycosyltransferase family 2 protein [Arthrobacter monumenti]
MFGHQISDRLQIVSSSLGTNDRTVHLAGHRNWFRNTHRQKAKAGTGALPEAAHPVRRPTVSVLIPTARPGRLEHIYQTVARQQDVQVQLVILTRGFCPADAYWRRLAHDHGIDDVVYLYLPEDVPLGECYNYCVRSADGDVVVMIDDEDYCGPHFLSDQLHSLEHPGADLVGLRNITCISRS